MTAPPLEDVLAARQRADELLEEGWGRSVVVEPLTALGGAIGGAIITVVALALGMRSLRRRG